MAQENINTPDTTEEVQANAEEQGTPDTEAVAPATLNRAQRRAQSRGKSSPGGPTSPATHQGGSHAGASGRASGHAGQVRFPRTGHK